MLSGTFRAPSFFQLSLVPSALNVLNTRPPCSLLENRDPVDGCVCCEKNIIDFLPF